MKKQHIQDFSEDITLEEMKDLQKVQQTLSDEAYSDYMQSIYF